MCAATSRRSLPLSTAASSTILSSDRRRRGVGFGVGFGVGARAVMTPRTLRRAAALAAALVMMCRAPSALATDFVLDGSTTYCWKVGASIYASSVDSASVSASSGDGCALTLAIDFPSTTVYAYDSVDVAWNATLRLDASANATTFLSNTFDVDELFAGLDRVSQRYYEVVHSRLHSCEYGASTCSPVSGSSQQADNTSNLVGNFSDAGVASFSSSDLVFSAPGNYTLLAHLILPGEVPTSERYDYAVFTKVEILSRSTATATTTPYTESSSTSSASSKAGMSTQVLCVIIISGIVAVAMFAIGVTTLRSKKGSDSGDEDDALDRRATKAKRRGMPFERRTGANQQPTPIAGGDSTLEENEFAMLSVHEATMSRPHNGGGGTFLSALGRPSAQHGSNSRPSPIPFVGPSCRQSIKRKPGYGGVEFEVGGNGSDRQVVAETPTSGRANYADMDPTPRPTPLVGRTGRPSMAPHRPSMAPHRPSTKIMFNDIEEEGESRVLPTASELHLGATAVDLDLTRVSRRIKHAISGEEDESWRSQKKLTADDLRETETKGPSLALSDLGLMRGAMRDSSFD